jgi:O-antigen ligase
MLKEVVLGKIKSRNILALIIVAIPTAYLNFSINESTIYLESALMLGISLLLVLWFLKTKELVSFMPIEVISVLLFLLIIVKNILANSIDVLAICFLGLTIGLYFGLKKLCFNSTAAANKSLLLEPLLFVLIFYNCFALYHCFVAKNAFSTLYIPNSSIFSILVATQLGFILPLVIHLKKESSQKWGIYAILICSMSLLIFTKGRAGLLGFIVALAYICHSCFKKERLKRIILYGAILLFTLLFAVLYFYKADSSRGRLLIYKASSSMLKNNWLLGIGHGQFKAKYNIAQVQYFSTHEIDSKEALLADNTYYAFNDFYQFIIEHGVLGIVFLFLILYLLYKQINNAAINDESKPLFVSAVASLVCIFIAALFSYPLQMFPIIFQALLCIAIICSFPQKVNKHFTLSKNVNKISLVIITVLFCVHYYFLLSYNLISKKAVNLNREGFKTKSLNTWNKLSQYYIKDGNTNYLYAQQLFYVNRVLEAKVVLAKSNSLYLSHEVYKLSAEIEKELKNFSKSEQDYKTAIFMVPNRMASRKNLLDFYITQKDTINALYWANSIMNMRIKIRSNITDRIQEKTSLILQEINK